MWDLDTLKKKNDEAAQRAAERRDKQPQETAPSKPEPRNTALDPTPNPGESLPVQVNLYFVIDADIPPDADAELIVKSRVTDFLSTFLVAMHQSQFRVDRDNHTVEFVGLPALLESLMAQRGQNEPN